MYGLVNALTCMSFTGSLNLSKIISHWSSQCTYIHRSQSLLPVWKGGSFAYRLMTLRLFTNQARQHNDGEHYDYVCGVLENSVSCALTPAEIEKALAEDMELNLIKECI